MRPSNLPFVWFEHTNFYGDTYFYGANHGVFTEENMRDPLIRGELNDAISYLMWCGYMQRPTSDAQYFLRYHRSAKQTYITGFTVSCQHGGLFMFNDGKYVFE